MALVIGNASAGYADGEPYQYAAAVAGGRQAPVELGAVTAIAAGYSHSLALRMDGTVVAWGSNYFGELGNGRFNWDTTPAPVQVCAIGQISPCARFGVIAIAAGQYHSLALLRDRTVVAWGYNSTGQLGDGTLSVRSTPVRVCAVAQVAPCSQLLTGVRTLTAGISHSLAQLTNGTAVAWGSNYYGQLGDSTTVDRLTPVRVCATGQVAPCGQRLDAVRAVAGGISHSMALLGNGSVVSWGSNFAGKLGDGTTLDRLTPVRVCARGQTAPCTQHLYGIRHISAGGSHSMAQLSSGGVLTWGANELGVLGDGGYQDQLTPVRVCAVGQSAPCTQYLVLIRAVSAGTSHNLALQVDYTVIAWGYNFYGELGDGTTITRPIPVQVLAPGP